MEAKKPQVINCHTHLFTSESVPPNLSRKMLPWPLSWILTVPLIINVFKFWYKNRRLSPLHFKYKPWYKSIKKYIFNLRSIWWGNAIFNLVKHYFIGHVFLILLHPTLLDFLQGRSLFNHRLDAVYFSLIKNKILFADIFGLIKWLFLGTMFLLSQDIRRFLFNLVKWSGQVARLIPDTENLKYLKRYLNIGRYAIHDKQSTIFTHLEGQYEVGTGFVVLPMDMAYMGAGEISKEGKYDNQMSALLDLKKKHKDSIFPFVFIDPRRIRAEKESFLNIKYNSTTAKVELHDCFVKKYIEDEKFNGFKIYPALGYYPFDEDLLLLWKYAIEKGLPLMSHVIRGTIFYRGNKAKEWNFHPVFTEADGDHNPLPLYERSNGKFSANFTHPLNFLCLLNERLLRKIVSQSNEEVKSAFGFTDLKTKLTSDLSQLKICFGHYGGDDEWKRYLNADRDNYAHSIVKNPTHGIDFLKNQNGDYTETKLEYVWRYVDWYSIVTSLLLQYPNTYADISYILSNEAIYPLLKSTLTNPSLRNKVLFGTDFYVVRNHKTEKQLLAEVRMYIGLEDFEQIGVVNPEEYLRSVNYGG